MEGALARLLATHAGPGRVDWIGIRPERRAPMQPMERAAVALDGIAGDHARPGKRAVTLLQAEHLPVIAALAQRGAVAPDLLRRNLLISAINLSALNGQTVRVGGAMLRLTGPCAPCSRMEEALGPGGYNAMRGHGGWCAEVLEPGEIMLGDAVLVSA
ncbi:MOSC domain-containing protein [Frigidibacter sp. RF13]|uniref:MOSC domain-containing protein n=1 Tax=Frigidibacter sp. RF13 TaxID=2997340 RepID=UPI0022717611|nr:MOSC domain-containing protein [Frigidibacter sp. RF13]MCY1125481.1 MOSC domain-containing protein [Frigidibacter sp. RF13]